MVYKPEGEPQKRMNACESDEIISKAPALWITHLNDWELLYESWAVLALQRPWVFIINYNPFKMVKLIMLMKKKKKKIQVIINLNKTNKKINRLLIIFVKIRLKCVGLFFPFAKNHSSAVCKIIYLKNKNQHF